MTVLFSFFISERFKKGFISDKLWLNYKTMHSDMIAGFPKPLVTNQDRRHSSVAPCMHAVPSVPVHRQAACVCLAAGDYGIWSLARHQPGTILFLTGVSGKKLPQNPSLPP